MPQLDVSFVLNDPMLSETFDVFRRVEVVGDDGRVQITRTSFPNQRGVITQKDPAQLTFRDDGVTVPRVIDIHTKFPLREATIGFQPDRVLWQGTSYLITKVYPWSKWGGGFTYAEASSVSAMDPPQ